MVKNERVAKPLQEYFTTLILKTVCVHLRTVTTICVLRFNF